MSRIQFFLSTFLLAFIFFVFMEVSVGLAEDTNAPNIQVKINERASDKGAVSSLNDITVLVHDREEGTITTSITAATQDGKTISPSTDTVNVSLEGNLKTQIVSGQENISLYSDNCNSKKLTPNGQQDSKCSLELRAKVTNTNPVDGVLRIGSEDETLIDLPVRVEVANEFCTPQNTKVSIGQCTEVCGGGERVVEWSDQCGNTWNETEPCNSIECVYSWDTGDWSECSLVCGNGQKHRTVVCKRGDGETVDESLCTEIKPEVSQFCNTQPCEVFNWKTSEWGACSKQCDGGLQFREVFCEQQSNSMRVSESLCSDVNTTKPPSMQECNTTACSFSWNIPEWGECSKECGGGFQTREVDCMSSDGRIVTDTFCDGEKAASVQHCNEQACIVYEWEIGTWSNCQGNCSGGGASVPGQKTRIVRCKSEFGEYVEDSFCEKKQAKPATSEACTYICSGSIEFRTAGNFTWAPPSGLQRAKVTIVGGGGGGGGGIDCGYAGAGGGGGAGGGAIQGIIDVSSNEEVAIIVGQGGIGNGPQIHGQDGGQSQFAAIIAPGGQGGRAAQSGGYCTPMPYDANGGQPASISGMNIFNGGNARRCGPGDSGASGGAGGIYPGNNRNMCQGGGGAGAGSPYGGDGGDGGKDTNGLNGTSCGGGGGGAGAHVSTSGGAGGNGCVIIEWGPDISSLEKNPQFAAANHIRSILNIAG